MATQSAVRTKRKQEITGPSVDSIHQEIVLNGLRQQIPYLNRGNLKADPYYWFYQPPESLFESFDEKFDVLQSILSEDGSKLEQTVTRLRPLLDEWCEKMQYLINDLKRIINKKYYRFWSYVLYDDDLHLVIENYLRFCPRWFDICDYLLTSEMKQLHQELHQTFIKLILRMSTNKESKTDHLSIEKFSQSLLDKIYDAARIVDICVMYGTSDDKEYSPLLRKVLQNIFTRQPGLVEQMSSFQDTICQSMMSISQEVCQESPSSSSGAVSLLSAASSLIQTLHSMSEAKLIEVCHAAVEITVCLLQIFRNSPVMVTELFEETVKNLPQFFDVVFTSLEEELDRREDFLPVEVKEALLEVLLTGESAAIHSFRCFIDTICLQDITNQEADDSVVLRNVERYYSIVMQAIHEKNFIIGYNSLFPIKDDYEILHAKYSSIIDDSQFDYLFSSIEVIMQEEMAEVLDEQNKEILQFPQSAAASQIQEIGAVGGYDNPKVNEVLAILPDLKPYFVQKCLEFYNDKTEELIMAIIDKNLHPELEKFRNAEPPQPDLPPPSSDIYPTLEEDCNVHIGKKDKLQNGFYNDANEKYIVKKFALQHTVIFDEVEVAEDKMYDDEYDDTYDSLMAGLPEKNTEDDAEVVRGFEVPRVLQNTKGMRRNKYAQEDDEDDLDEEEKQRRKMEFCENPEVIRERREQKYQARMAQRGRPPPPQKDVVGANKGQGQSHDVLRNRQLKERHKGSNRRNQADYKRKEF